MKRREMLTTIGAGLLTPVSLRPTLFAQTPAQARASVPAAEYEPFRKIAQAKGVRIFTDQSAPSAATSELNALHLDMNMVKASIENAISRTQQDPELNQKLRRLLANGTAVQQVEFVHGTGRYYFPEDVEQAITESTRPRAAAAQANCWICTTVCTVVCNCLGNGDQYCKDRCREVCKKHC